MWFLWPWFQTLSDSVDLNSGLVSAGACEPLFAAERVVGLDIYVRLSLWCCKVGRFCSKPQALGCAMQRACVCRIASSLSNCMDRWELQLSRL